MAYPKAKYRRRKTKYYGKKIGGGSGGSLTVIENHRHRHKHYHRHIDNGGDKNESGGKGGKGGGGGGKVTTYYKKIKSSYEASKYVDSRHNRSDPQSLDY